ncbi:uracil-DNA glycosylase family 4 [Streptomyces sp. V4I23]|uniref:uracil-DNA glycosylase n=1 Tax=Streptomyces sp. V4I23 TaxID=3042282 RepID=UPI00277FAC41|nr:uracil-DNA glycosylase [Streptomyces sp. V4I23]MDQ1012531.1 uracil-DNA glycosylase family 4 [Streptomyces sp. V4I23]
MTPRHERSVRGDDDAGDPDFPARTAPHCSGLGELDAQVARCRACPRLVAWREGVAAERRAAFREWEYWGRPVPGFGPDDAVLAVVGLAPAAHGGNRTGRMFTGDDSGDVLFAALHAAGLASQPTSTHRGDGLRLRGVRVTAPVHCAPPQNRPTPEERDTCRPWLAAELGLLTGLRGVVVLGAFGWQAVLPVLAAAGYRLPRPRPLFGHGAHATLPAGDGSGELHLFGCYHPSRRNVFTGRVTLPMLVEVFRRAARVTGLDPAPPASGADAPGPCPG